jgi:hypothetical protein
MKGIGPEITTIAVTFVVFILILGIGASIAGNVRTINQKNEVISAANLYNYTTYVYNCSMEPTRGSLFTNYSDPLMTSPVNTTISVFNITGAGASKLGGRNSWYISGTTICFFGTAADILLVGQNYTIVNLTYDYNRDLPSFSRNVSVYSEQGINNFAAQTKNGGTVIGMVIVMVAFFGMVGYLFFKRQ